MPSSRRTSPSHAHARIGRNEPCPSGAGVKFKKCLLRHPGLNPKGTAATVWWFCDRWQSEEPEASALYDAWRQLPETAPDKTERFFERLLAESPESVDWPALLRECRQKRHLNLPKWYRRMTQSLRDVKGSQPGRVQSTAAEIFRSDHPELYEEILAASLALDPASTEPRSLENIVEWALEKGCLEDCGRLRERFPGFPEYLFAAVDDEEDTGSAEPDDSEPSSSGVSDEVKTRLDEIWNRFDAVETPIPKEADLLIDELLSLPCEATCWSDVFDAVRKAKHPAPFDVFARIVSTIPPSESSFQFVCWGGVEEAVTRGEINRLPDIARQLHRVEPPDFDSDAVTNVADYLLAYGFSDDCLTLLERLFPSLRDNDDILEWVPVHYGEEIVNLRLGRQLGVRDLSTANPDDVLADLMRGLDGIIKDKVTGQLVRRVLDETAPANSRDDFQLPLAHHSRKQMYGIWVTIQAALARVAREEGLSEAADPARTFSGLHSIYRAAQRWHDSRKKGQGRLQNLLDFIVPTLIERLVIDECRDAFGLNRPRAFTMLDAFRSLTRHADRQNFMPAKQALRVDEKVAELLSQLDLPIPGN